MDILRLFSRQKPKIKVETAKKGNGFDGFTKCSGCEETIHVTELSQNLNCCSKCNYHYRLSCEERKNLLADAGTFIEMFSDLKTADPLEFVDDEKYATRLEKSVAKTKRNEAVLVGTCLIGGQKSALAIMDFSFMGGSMGSVVGEMLTLITEYATEHRLPLVIVSASGGARMQESIFSLMQMAKTSAALARHSEKSLPYISILTNPTMGGVTASFASLGDIIIAEPKALIGFAGPRVVEQTIRQKLPEGAQQSEFLLEKGMIDCIVSRKELKDKVSFFIEFLMNGNKND
jgi:acetyl-CoA carboxylase carboxyl transferase subunit beta